MVVGSSYSLAIEDIGQLNISYSVVEERGGGGLQAIPMGVEGSSPDAQILLFFVSSPRGSVWQGSSNYERNEECFMISL
jgi:hypothetical protein